MASALPIPGEITLASKYTLEEGKIFLSGIQALVRLPIDQHRLDRRRGLNTATLISGYPGSPLGGVDAELHRQARLLEAHHIRFWPGVNEELAMTAVWGTQMLHMFPGAKYDGVLGMWYGKAPGLDRSTDVLRHANYVGAGQHGGMLMVVGDDPIGKSSSLASDSTYLFCDTMVPILYPGNVQDILDLGLHGFSLSRAAGLAVGLKVVTNLADASGTATVSLEQFQPVIPTVEQDGAPYEHRLFIPFSLESERTLMTVRTELAMRYARENQLNRITVPTRDAWLGILTAGKSYYDLREALYNLGLDDAALRHHGIRILKMGMVFPVEPEIVKEFARGLQEILVVEEKRPFLESAVKALLYGHAERPVVVGKQTESGEPLLPATGELDPDLIARAVAARLRRKIHLASVEARLAKLDEVNRRSVTLPIARTPFYCSGCPHNRSTRLPDGSFSSAGIGCHGMAMFFDPQHVRGITAMGGEGAHWIGIAPFSETPHLFQNLGDGTLSHSALLAISAAVDAGVSITYKILYNGTVAMTGGQRVAGVRSIPDLTRQLEAMGVKRIIVTTDDLSRYRGVSLSAKAELWHRDRLIEAQSALAAVPGVTVLIHDQQCAAEKRRLRKRGKQAPPARRVLVNDRVCEGCGDCSKQSNCLSVQTITTEFGEKTQIHQSSCNMDYSCLLGDCPSFLLVETTREQETPRRIPPLPADLPEPVRKVTADPFTLRLAGIGGTGVVTANQIIGMAAHIEGKHVRALDQTGFAQKGGPVVCDLKICADPVPVSNKVMAARADLYLVADLLTGTDRKNLAAADRERTIAVVSTSQIQTGQMVRDKSIRFPPVNGLVSEIESVTRRGENVYLNAQAIAEGLFGDHMQTNILLVGAAYQAGALPLSAAAIEQAIRLNGTAVEANLAAFRWGRLAVIDPDRVQAAIARESGAAPTPPAVTGAARQIIDATGATGELKRLLEIRVPELIAYQNRAYAQEYAAFVQKAAQVERQRTQGRSQQIAAAVARHLYKLMAYKDEYEVARLHLEGIAQIRAQFGPRARFQWLLHPPVLRALGMKKKLKLGPWFAIGFRALRGLRWLRGTPLDPFGYAQVRRVERSLIREYRQAVETALEKLTPDHYGIVLAIAELPDQIRGYEQVKLDAVQRYRAALKDLLAQLDTAARKGA